jgi:ADP-ribose pyrophosphatase YjhB (NUDIX family)
MPEMLNIVNDNDEIIGQETRENIHRDGLLHREVYIDFITPNQEIILQHRAKDKETFPNLLDATVGGHVEIGDSYEQTVTKETEEETGVIIKINDLIPIGKIQRRGVDPVTHKINYAFSSRYLYIYRGDIKDLRVEAGKSLGFEAWPLARLANLTAEEKLRFIPSLLTFVTQELPELIKQLNLK